MAAIRMMKYDQVKLSAASRNRFGNFPDSSEQHKLLQQCWRDSAADVSHDDGLAGFDSKHMRRVHAHIGATDDYRFQSLQGLRKHWHGGSELFVEFQHEVKVIHEDSPEESFEAVAPHRRVCHFRCKRHFDSSKRLRTKSQPFLPIGR
jgi:hypothetical protein